MRDSEIVEMYCNRNMLAVQYTQEQYGGQLQRFAERMLGNREDGMECVNDTLMQAWNTIPPNCPEHLSAYLFTLCRNLALNQIDWKNAKKRKATCIELTKEMEECIPDTADVYSENVMELGKLITTFLQTQTKERRQMFLCRYWYGDSVRSIAEIFHCSENRVNVTLHRVRKELKKYLEKEGIRL